MFLEDPMWVPMPLSSLQMYRSVAQEECKEAEGGDPSPLLSPGDIWDAEPSAGFPSTKEV